MYKDVGKEIKFWAKVSVVLLTIPFVLVGIFVWLLLIEARSGFVGFFVGLIVALIGYFFARLGSILLYGYGELIDRTCSIDEKLGPAKRADTVQSEVKKVSSPSKTMNCFCPNCGKENYYSNQKCDKCYTPKP